jgi:hypothetical protein
MRIRILVAALAGAVAALAAPPAHAAPPGPNVPSLHVLEVATDDADGQAKAVTLALRHRVRESKEYSLADSDHSLQVLTLALHCPDPPDAACQNTIAGKLNNARQYFWGTMKKVPGNQVTLDLHLWQQRRDDVHERFTFTDNITDPRDPSLERLVDQMYQRLVFYGRVGVARLVADQALEGELFVNGRSYGSITHAQHELTLPPGDYTFEVRSGGRVSMSGRGRVAVTQVQEVRLVPMRNRADAGASSLVEAPVLPPAPESGQRDAWRKPVGIASLSVGAALLAAGAYSSYRVSTYEDDEVYSAYLRTVPKGQDACDYADPAKPSDVKNICSNAKTLQIVQYVAYPLGAVAVGAGLFFLLTGPHASTAAASSGSAKAPRRWALIPSAAPTQTGLDFHLAF